MRPYLQRKRLGNRLLSLRLKLTLFLIGSFSLLATNGLELFNVKFLEKDGSRLVATSNSNYALTSPKLAIKNWRTVSVNGNELLIAKIDGEKVLLSGGNLDGDNLQFVELLRNEIANTNGGYLQTSTAFDDSNGSSVVSASSSSVSSSSSFSSSLTDGKRPGGEMSYSVRDSNNFSIARSDLPFGWSRIFINENLVTIVFRDGQVQMLPMNLLEEVQIEAINKLKLEAEAMQRSQTQQITNTMAQSMNMVSNVFSDIMNRFPKPPSYQSAVGNMFGSNFPFGPDNSPFDSAAGWPFGGGLDGASAVAFAPARRRRR